MKKQTTTSVTNANVMHVFVKGRKTMPKRRMQNLPKSCMRALLLLPLRAVNHGEQHETSGGLNRLYSVALCSAGCSA